MKQTQKYDTFSQITIKQLALIVSLSTFMVLFLAACGSQAASEPAAVDTSPEQSEYEGKKIVWVDSYHEGYEWSDGIAEGLKSVLDGTGAEVKTLHMDTKRNIDPAFGEQAGKDAWAEIQAFEPDVVIACDDNAQTYLVVPYIKDTDLPVVFCGVNWDASIYGYPTENVTGMVEVDLAENMADLLRTYAKGDRIAYLSGESETERKLIAVFNDRFFNGEMEGIFVTNVEDWKSEFLRLQNDADMIFFSNNAGIEGWDNADAEAFVLENVQIPIGSTNDWMAPYVLFNVFKSPNEHGAWSAETALRIIDGTPVSDIPLSENKESGFIINLNIADKLDAVIDPAILRQAEIYGE